MWQCVVLTRTFSLNTTSFFTPVSALDTLSQPFWFCGLYSMNCGALLHVGIRMSSAWEEPAHWAMPANQQYKLCSESHSYFFFLLSVSTAAALTKSCCTQLGYTTLSIAPWTLTLLHTYPLQSVARNSDLKVIAWLYLGDETAIPWAHQRRRSIRRVLLLLQYFATYAVCCLKL